MIFCSHCGGKLAVLGERPLAAQTCGVCGTTHYHGAHPCAGALVVREHAVLLVRRALEPFKDYWDIPGGFLEAGEHPEEGARREVLEETGLEVKITGLHGIYTLISLKFSAHSQISVLENAVKIGVF